MATGARLAAYDTESLSEHLNRFSHSERRGIRYARKEHVGAGELQSAKNIARNRVLSTLVTDAECKSIFTMPGLNWSLEKSFIAHRKKKASVYAIESDEAIFRASIQAMPGANYYLSVKESQPPETIAIRSPLVKRYSRVDFHDYAHTDKRTYDAAWLDFNGQITAKRLDAITALWPRINRHLFVTSLNGRTPIDEEKVLDALPDGIVTDVHKYTNGHAPMIQISVMRRDVFSY